MTGETLLEQAAALLAGNTRTGSLGGRTFTFSIPSEERYRFQWFWDSCFHATVWARIDPGRAAAELRGLLARQREDGLVPHVIFWDRSLVRRLSWQALESAAPPGCAPEATAMMQPPVIAQAVEAVVEAGEEGFLGEALPALERYYRYLAERRDPDGRGLIAILSRFESGLDFSPVFDRRPGAPASARELALSARLPQVLDKVLAYDPGRLFRLGAPRYIDVLVNTVYADGLQALARLAGRAGSGSLAGWAAAQARMVTERLLERCYDERRGLFFNLAGRAERRVASVKTVGSLLPLLLVDLPADVAARLVEHLADPREFWAPFPVPSVALDEPVFSPDSLIDGRRRIWRGPASLNTNWLLATGLRRHGEHALAGELADRCRELVERGGFNEFYNPLDGSPAGAPRFGWATLAALI